jgi:hypothetical protein
MQTMSADFLFIDSGGRYEKIALVTLLYITAHAKATYFFTSAGVVVTPFPLQHIERFLPKSQRFCRINDAQVVVLDKIISFDEQSVLMPGALLPLSRHYEPQLRSSVRILEQLPQQEQPGDWWVDEAGKVNGEW